MKKKNFEINEKVKDWMWCAFNGAIVILGLILIFLMMQYSEKQSAIMHERREKIAAEKVDIIELCNSTPESIIEMSVEDQNGLLTTYENFYIEIKNGSVTYKKNISRKVFESCKVSYENLISTDTKFED